MRRPTTRLANIRTALAKLATTLAILTAVIAPVAASALHRITAVVQKVEVLHRDLVPVSGSQR